MNSVQIQVNSGLLARKVNKHGQDEGFIPLVNGTYKAVMDHDGNITINDISSNAAYISFERFKYFLKQGQISIL